MNSMRARRAFLALGSAIALALPLAPALAQDTYPARPIRLVVGLQPGGVTDLVARVVANELSRALGQPVTVDNVAGAGGFIASQQVARAPADGYVIQLGTTSTNVLAPLLQGGAGFNPLTELQPVGVIGVAPLVLFANPKVGATTAHDLVNLAKRSPGKLNYGSAGPGTTSHLAGELFKLNFGGLDIVHVAYKGGPAMDQAVVTGEVSFAFDAPGGIAELHNAGRVKALAMMAERRNDVMPNVPTAREAGLGDLTAGITYYVFTPSRTPPRVAAVLQSALTKIRANPAFVKDLARNGLDASTATPEEAPGYVEREFKRWRDVIAKQNLKLN